MSIERRASDSKIEESDEKYGTATHLEEEPTLVSGAKKVAEAKNAAFTAAKLKGALEPWSRESLVLYSCAAVGFMCSIANGYDGSLMTGINGMEYFKETFNHGNKASSTGLLFSMYTVGQLTGSIYSGQIADRFGRRAGMFVGCLIVLIGTAVVSSSNNQHQFVAGRFILGMGVAITITAAPAYVIEVSPPQWRGRMTALYNTGWYGGSIPAAAIVFGTQYMPSNWSWRIPLIIQAVPAGFVTLIIWFLPETPRWLFMNSREEEAIAFLVKYHGNRDPDNEVVRLELEEFRSNISTEGSDKRWWDYSALFVTSNARWRSLMVFMMGLFGQMSGNGLGYFNLDIYKSIGFDVTMQFAMNLIGAITNAFCSCVAVAFSDRMPRRTVLIFGTLSCSVLLACNAGLSAKWASYEPGHENKNVGKLAAAFYFFFGQAFAFTYTPLQSLYPAECLETTTRAKGLSMKIFVISITSFINLYCLPISLQNIKWKTMLIFVFWDAFETVMWYLFCIETQGRTLEELDEVFSSPNPVKMSKQKQKIAIVGTGDVVVLHEATA